MTRFLILLLLLSFLGCKPPVAGVSLTPVDVDEAAAYPSQEPGTRPPVLTGLTPLMQDQLDDGWVQLFDGVSTFGWVVTEGDGTLAVMSDGKKNFLALNKKDNEIVDVSHRFCEAKIEFKDDAEMACVGTIGWATHYNAWGNTGVNGLRARPNSLLSLTESDWKPAAGQCKAKWTDGVLELTGGSGMIETVKEYDDFVLQLEYFTEKAPDGKGCNSGVFFRCIPGEIMNGYECQIFNSPPDDDYTKFIGTDTGGIFRRQVGRNVGPKDGQWNYLTVAARGPNVATWVNGIQVTDWTDAREEHPNPRNGRRLEPGTIQLQGHDPGTKIQFRNFRIAELQ